MNSKVGRNDSCPCGSGRKYKHCCGRPAAAPTPSSDGHDGAVARALAWLAQHHRKAFAAALQEAVDEALYDIFDNEDEAHAAMAGIDGELWDHIQLNLTEWLLAEGDIHVKGKRERVADHLLGPRGPLQQLLIASPPSCTVQAPQLPVSQPTCVPVRSRSSRRKCTSSSDAGTSRS